MLIQKSRAGFSLIELMVVVSIAGILAVMAVPSFQGFLESSRVDSTANNLYTAALVARSEAITRGTPMTLCASSNLAACDANANWNNGWIVTDGAAAIRVWEATPVAIASTGGVNIVFNTDSSVNPGNGTTFTISQGASLRNITINSRGKPRNGS